MKSFSCLIRRIWKKDDLATDFICGMRESEESKVKPKLWMVEEGASRRFDEINKNKHSLYSKEQN